MKRKSKFKPKGDIRVKRKQKYGIKKLTLAKKSKVEWSFPRDIVIEVGIQILKQKQINVLEKNKLKPKEDRDLLKKIRNLAERDKKEKLELDKRNKALQRHREKVYKLEPSERPTYLKRHKLDPKVIYIKNK